jgi:uncharacterized protein (TIGR02246 family)
MFFARLPRPCPGFAQGQWCRWSLVVAIVVTTAVCLVSPTSAAEPAVGRAADEAAIRAASQAYVAALAKGDAAALAAAWTPDGDIVDAAGNVLPGRATMSLEKATGSDRPQITIHETKLRFLAADAAIEDGVVEIVPQTGGPLNGRFSATWVRHEGVWKLAALREARGTELTGPAALADLEWMVGEWRVIDEHPAADHTAGEPLIEVSTKWNETKTFLNRVMTITHSKDAPPLRITQRIGWDPLSRSIRSWVFGSDGSYGEATWNRDGQSWVAEARAVMPDGRQTSSLNIYSYDGKDRCAWRSVPTHIGGEHVPRVDLTMIRQEAAAVRQP